MTSEEFSDKINEISATGTNVFEKGFTNKQKINNHWKNGRTHKEEYIKDNIITVDNHEKRALTLIQSECDSNILGYKNKHNQIVRYDIKKWLR